MHNQRISQRTKKILAAVSAVSLISIGGVSTYAGYTDSSQITVNAAAGRTSVNVTSDVVGAYGIPAVISYDEFTAGDSRTSNMTVVNTGTTPVRYSMISGDGTTRPGTEGFQVTVKAGSTTLYSGAPDNMGFRNRKLEAGATDIITTTITFNTTDYFRLQDTVFSMPLVIIESVAAD